MHRVHLLRKFGRINPVKLVCQFGGTNLKEMKKFLPLLFIVHFSLFISHADAQKEGQILTDSLLEVLKSAREDTAKVNLLSDLSKQYYQIADYANSMKALANRARKDAFFPK